MAVIISDITRLEKTAFGETTYIDWKEYINDTLQLLFCIKDDQVPPQNVDFNGCSCEFIIYADKGLDTGLLTVSTVDDGVVLGGVDNNLVVTVTPEQIQVASLVRGKYYYKIRMTYPDNYVNTEFAGVLKLE